MVKGPQGTLFGRGAEIGAMHLLRHKPTGTLGGEVKVNYGRTISVGPRDTSTRR